MLKKMKRVAMDSSPSYMVDEEARTRFKHQSLMQDYHDLLKVTVGVDEGYSFFVRPTRRRKPSGGRIIGWTGSRGDGNGECGGSGSGGGFEVACELSDRRGREEAGTKKQKKADGSPAPCGATWPRAHGGASKWA